MPSVVRAVVVRAVVVRAVVVRAVVVRAVIVRAVVVRAFVVRAVVVRAVVVRVVILVRAVVGCPINGACIGLQTPFIQCGHVGGIHEEGVYPVTAEWQQCRRN